MQEFSDLITLFTDAYSSASLLFMTKLEPRALITKLIYVETLFQFILLEGNPNLTHFMRIVMLQNAQRVQETTKGTILNSTSELLTATQTITLSVSRTVDTIGGRCLSFIIQRNDQNEVTTLYFCSFGFCTVSVMKFSFNIRQGNTAGKLN